MEWSLILSLNSFINNVETLNDISCNDFVSVVVKDI
jgi:hypothetical protein